jgi:hypothetical protein
MPGRAVCNARSSNCRTLSAVTRSGQSSRCSLSARSPFLDRRAVHLAEAAVAFEPVAQPAGSSPPARWASLRQSSSRAACGHACCPGGPGTHAVAARPRRWQLGHGGTHPPLPPRRAPRYRPAPRAMSSANRRVGWTRIAQLAHRPMNLVRSTSRAAGRPGVQMLQPQSLHRQVGRTSRSEFLHEDAQTSASFSRGWTASCGRRRATRGSRPQ